MEMAIPSSQGKKKREISSSQGKKERGRAAQPKGDVGENLADGLPLSGKHLLQCMCRHTLLQAIFAKR